LLKGDKPNIFPAQGVLEAYMGRLGTVLLFVVCTVSAAFLGAVGKDAWDIAKGHWNLSPTQVVKKTDRAVPASGSGNKNDGGDFVGGCCNITDGYQGQGKITDGYTGGNWSGSGFGDSGVCCEMAKPRKSRNVGEAAPKQVIIISDLLLAGTSIK
jgi:hypothetical protein